MRLYAVHFRQFTEVRYAAHPLFVKNRVIITHSVRANEPHPSLVSDYYDYVCFPSTVKSTSSCVNESQRPRARAVCILYICVFMYKSIIIIIIIIDTDYDFIYCALQSQYNILYSYIISCGDVLYF